MALCRPGSSFLRKPDYCSLARRNRLGNPAVEIFETFITPLLFAELVRMGVQIVGFARFVAASMTWLRLATPLMVNESVPFVSTLKFVIAGGGRLMTVMLLVAL